jgi:hypothetical protein
VLHLRPLQRLTPFVLAGAAILAVTSSTVGRTRLAPPSISLASGESIVGGVISVTAANDWATRVFNDPQDMTLRSDISWWSFSNDLPLTHLGEAGTGSPVFTPCTTTGSSTDSATRCLKGTTTSDDANFYLLETGGPSQPIPGRTGDLFPIDTSLYKRITMRMRLGGAPQATMLSNNPPSSMMNFIWYERTMYNSPAVTSENLRVTGDWVVYSVDLTTLTKSGSPPWGSHTVRTLRVNPVFVNNVPIEVDWVRLTPATVQTTTISWSVPTADGVDIYLDTDNNISNGYVGTLQQPSCNSTAGCTSTALFDQFSGGNVHHPVLHRTTGNYTIPVGSLAPGEYYIQVCHSRTTDCAVTPWRYRVNAAPTLTFTNPSPEGSNDDFATIQLNDPWDFTSLSDIDDEYFMTNLRTSTIDATTESGIALGNVNGIRASSLASGNTGDPYFYTLWFAGDGRGRFKKIDSVKYHIFTVEMGIPNKRRDLDDGSIVRLVWMVDGETLENVSTDLNLNSTSGENTMAKFTVSMKTCPTPTTGPHRCLALATPKPEDPNPSPSRSGWVGSISSFRLDPHEFTPATEFYVKRMKLASNEVAVNNLYTVRWTYTDPDNGPGTPTMTVSWDTDRDPSTLGGTICTVNPATTSSCLWDTINRAFGEYYVYASFSDGSSTNAAYGDWPVRVAGDTVDPASKPRIVLDRRRLDFGGRYNYPADATVTPAQTVRVSIAGAGGSGVAWQAASNNSDVIVSPTSGTGDGTITISMRAKTGNESYPPNLVGDYAVTVSEVVAGATANSPQTIRVFFTMYANNATSAPFGSFDTPADGATNVSGSIPVTGWALDDIGIDRVEIWRDRIVNDSAPGYPDQNHPAFGKVFIANGIMADGSRPDVESGFPGRPLNYRSGWGYLLLTINMGGVGVSNGTFKLTAIAWDKEGRSTILGSKTITLNNAGATKPFGSIDVPSYGATFSGRQFTFGWALTPAAGCTVAGGQVFMTIDGAPPNFPVNYGDPRPDIAASFPGYSDAGNAGGAVFLDSFNYANGTHQIGWLVYDSCGNGDGVGSRFFTIQNSSGDAGGKPAPAPLLATKYTTFPQLGLKARPGAAQPPPVHVARGFRNATAPVPASRAGRRVVEIAPYERIELHVGSALPARPGRPTGGYEAYQVVDGELRALPLGSSFDPRTGVFYWQPAAGFRGDFDLVFMRDAHDTPVHVRVAVGKPGL